MGNSNHKIDHYSRRKYNSQCSLSSIISGSCTGQSQSVYEECRPWSRISRRTWTEGTLNDPLNSSKTAWPVPKFEAIFLPEFKVREQPINNEYNFIKFIAKGAYGRVYKVEDNVSGNVYALKVISKSKIIEENAIEQVKEEVAIQKAVSSHPFIVRSCHHWQGRKTLYMLTEFINCGELYYLIREYKTLPEEVVRIYVAELALAIDFLHNAGIVHRDLKATNVLLDNEGHAVLIDFGLAKWLRPLHRTNTFCGTQEYMAPEIVRREYYGHEVDWWALGVLTCVLLTNKAWPPPSFLLSSPASRGFLQAYQRVWLADAGVHEPCEPPGSRFPCVR
ncbi:Similar to S6KL: Serine/threonine-protein kinase S6KL (Drosophila melanogaster) [Cotesia congregata]|uniref:Similar to S6KL: Serine/threonine-protein kinase S6KL (Drosophila melanogaster) n=1 Tax=Cotesia congregata TaxID=51543 RepID=A0A8J2HBL4_COTCN|nr:Similar to S6KL: Serine/threonine-protein kinase S6KL (Drosophila melanogaster) [Cotesia congregata]